MLRASSETASVARDLRVERKIFPDVCISCFAVLVFDIGLADCRSLLPRCVCSVYLYLYIYICVWSASHTNTNNNTNKTHTLHSNTNTTTPTHQHPLPKRKEKEKREREKRKREEREKRERREGEKRMKGERKDKEKEKRERERRKRKTDYSYSWTLLENYFQLQLQACLLTVGPSPGIRNVILLREWYVWNMDGTYVRLVPSPSKTWGYPGKLATAIPEDKAGFAAKVAILAVYGEPTFIQMCVKEKKDQVHPVGSHPHALSMTHSVGMGICKHHR